MALKITDEIRKDFPLLVSNPAAYLDSAATSQRPQCVIDAVADFYKRANANPLRGLYALSVDATDRYEAARDAAAGFLHAKESAEIIFTRNTTESLNLAAYSYGLTNLRAGDEIVVSITEHHSNILPWQMVAGRTGAALRYLECEKDGTITDESIAETITERTRLVAVGEVSNVTGRRNPLEKIIERAHRAGAVVVVDGAQSTPHMAVDVQALDADFFAFSGHKILGPMGIGVLYGKRELLEAMPPFLTGGEMIQTVTREGAVWAELPHKFEAGTVNAADAAGLHAAIDYIGKLGYEAIREREEVLTALAMEGLQAIPHLKILGSEDPAEHNGILNFVIEGVHPHDISAILDADGICVRAGHHCAQPLLKHLGYNSTTRASLMFYNTEDEVRRLVECVSTIRRRMGFGE
ncbi:MAG TPA: cysteine desulfurase [Lachnospiraceae bacterium]|nr:cysteine desulfurase [Lachnospiraceae bacterium]